MKVLKLGDELRPVHGLTQPRAGIRLAATREGLDLGIMNAPPIPFARLRALVACSATVHGGDLPVLILFVDWTERPFKVDASQMVRQSFGLAANLRPEEAVRQAIRRLAPQLPHVIVDDATAHFLQGEKPLRPVGKRLDDLAHTMAEALKRVPASALSPPPAAAPAEPPPRQPPAASPPPAAPPLAPQASPVAPTHPVASPPVAAAPVASPPVAAPGPAESSPVDTSSALEPVLWHDEFTGSIALLTPSKIVLSPVKREELESTLDTIGRRGGDPQAVPGLVTTVVPVRSIREIARDVERRRVEIRYRQGDSNRSARIRYYAEHNAALLLGSLQEKLGVSFSDHDQVPGDVKWKTAGAWITGSILTAFTALLPVVPYLQHGKADFSNVPWWDVAIVLGLTIGIYLNNRACALFLFLFYALTKIYQWVQLESLRPLLPGIPVALLISYFLLQGVAGTARYHELKVLYSKDAKIGG